MTETLTKPFRGLLYNSRKSADIARVVCPPYDVVSDPSIYYERSPLNAIRLEVPLPVPPADQYTRARQTMDHWLSDNILVQDKNETIYIYEQEFVLEGASFLRRGFIGLHKLGKERILTHEETRKKAKADREQLINTLKTYTSLIFGLYEDSEEEIEKILRDSEKETIYDFIDEQSIRNRFYRMTAAGDIARLVSAMNTRNIYIADGHHRLDVSYRLNIPYVPFYLTSMYSRGTVILPYHRIINLEKTRSLTELLGLLKEYTAITRSPYTGRESVHEALEGVSNTALPAFVLYSKDDLGALYVVTVTKPLPLYEDEDIHDRLKRLKVNVIHSGVIRKLLRIEDREISFTQDHYKSIDLVRKGSLDLAFFLPPTTVEEVKHIADNGLYMPPKSTFFYPKILTGLVFYQYA